MSSFISRLEPRYIFDAGAVASGVAVAADVAAQSEAVEQINEILASDGQSVSIASFSEQVERLAMVGYTEDMTSGKMIVFVDADLGASKIATLKSGLAAGVELHLINSNADALVQMAAVLEGYREVSSVHILSHGSAGILAIGDSDVDFSALTSAQQAALYSMNVQLASNADLLIYGCDFGAGELGKAAVNVLSNFTGADVAASDDATGSTRLGADWDLETTIGQIETEIAFSAKVQDAFEITLSNTVTVSGSTHPKGWFNIADSDLGTVTLTIDDTENLVADGDADNLSLIGLSIGSITAVALDGSRSNPTLPDDIDLSHIPVTTQKTVDGEYTLSFSTGDLIDTLKTHLGDQVMTGNLTFTVGTGSSSVDATLDNFFTILHHLQHRLILHCWLRMTQVHRIVMGSLAKIQILQLQVVQNLVRRSKFSLVIN